MTGEGKQGGRIENFSLLLILSYPVIGLVSQVPKR
jgi:hypothetical protein